VSSHAQHVGDVVVLVGLEDVVLDLGQPLADLGVHALVLQVRVHGERLHDALDEPALGLHRPVADVLELAEQLADLLVVLLQQHDRVGRHRLSLRSACGVGRARIPG
jgi:hypothetical protein